MTLNQSLNQDLQYAIEVARGGGKIAMDYFGKVERLTKTHAAPAKGKGCWLGTRRLTALSTPMGDASILMMTSNCCDASGRAPAYAARWISQTNWKLRIIGSAALEAAQVAAGIAHGAITINGKLWDAAAPAVLVIE